MKSAIFLLLLLALPAQADDFVTEVRARLGTPEVIRGQFEQKKFISALGRPLISSGDFIIARERGVLWRTQKPFAQTLRFSRQEIVQMQGGELRLRLTAEREPAVRAINQVLFALFAGDLGVLEKSFTISGKLDHAPGKPDQWRAILHPSSNSLAQLFQEIRIDGTSHVQRVEILETNGDRADIRFDRVQKQSSLGAEEARQLE